MLPKPIDLRRLVATIEAACSLVETSSCQPEEMRLAVGA